MEEKPRVRKLKPTVRQIRALQLIKQGKSVRGALKEAGYSFSIYNKSTQFFKGKSVRKQIENMQSKMEQAGLNDDYMIMKFKEWLEAQKTDHSHTEPDRLVPDYETQLRAGKLYFERLDKLHTPQNVKRKLTIEEFVDNNAQ